MSAGDLARQRALRGLFAEITRMTGRRYQLDLSGLDARSLLELQRLLRDLQSDHHAELERVRRMPWRR